MTLFHTCQWEEIQRYFIPPTSGKFSASNVSTIAVDRLVYGITQIECKCKKCGRIEFMDVIGDCTK